MSNELKSTIVFRVALIVALVMGSQEALGQTSSSFEEGKRKFEQAVEIMHKDRNFPVACPLLEESIRLSPNVLGAYEALGYCHAQLGRPASAWQAYMKGYELATKNNDLRAKKFLKLSQDTASKAPKITVEMPEKVNGLSGTTVLMQGQPVEAKQWNVPIPVDAGEIEIHVKTPSGKTWTHRIRIESATDKQSVTIPAELFVEPKKETPPPPSTKPAPRKQWQSKLGWVSMGTGLLSFGACGLLVREALQLKDASNADGLCEPNNVCDKKGFLLREKSLTLSHGGTATFALGSVLVATGIVLNVIGSKETAPPPNGKRSGLSLGVDFGPGNIGLHGTW